jgi:tetratricopeptide (TPR) repeat protein
LPAALTQLLREHCRQGYAYYDQGNFKQAIRCFFTAWTKIPKPQPHWQESGWILTALGDAYFRKGDFDNALEALNSALHCPNTTNNPFIYLRLGQCYWETAASRKARLAFGKVIQLGGAELFAQEDAKYQSCIPKS